MTPEKYRYERAAAVGKNVNLKERTDRGIGAWESEKPVLCNKSLALTFNSFGAVVEKTRHPIS